MRPDQIRPCFRTCHCFNYAAL